MLVADKAWRTFRAWPIWGQILGWLFLFWILIPILVWRTSWGTAWKVVAIVAFLFLLAGIGSDRPAPNISTVTGDGATEAGAEAVEPAASPSPDQDQEDEEEDQGDDDNATQTEDARRTTFVVARVVDGDTIEAQAGAKLLDIRLIGVDTPETVHPSKPVQCFGSKASTFTKNQLEGQKVRLEFDVEKRDRYGRTLAYVWVDNKLFNETLVAKGFGQVDTYPPNVKYVDRFRRAQRAARNNDRGLWSACRGEGSQSEGSGNADSTSGDTGGDCDPNYDGACIPPYPPDLNCDDVSATGFRSVGTDPHGFDGDADGIACE